MQVEEAMKVFDKDRSGSLDFAEFVTMFCEAENFKFKVKILHGLLTLPALTAITMLSSFATR